MMPILQVRDKDGKFVPIPAIKGDKGEKGEQGKSAYEQAVAGGYTGTEEEFIALLNGLENTASVEYVDEKIAQISSSKKNTLLAASYADSGKTVTVENAIVDYQFLLIEVYNNDICDMLFFPIGFITYMPHKYRVPNNTDLLFEMYQEENNIILKNLPEGTLHDNCYHIYFTN